MLKILFSSLALLATLNADGITYSIDDTQYINDLNKNGWIFVNKKNSDLNKSVKNINKKVVKTKEEVKKEKLFTIESATKDESGCNSVKETGCKSNR